jgi:hypothetical protein
MSLDNPRVRASLVCPLCNGAKDRGLVACWPCFRTSGLKEGAAEPERKIAAREAQLAHVEAVRKQLARNGGYLSPYR